MKDETLPNYNSLEGVINLFVPIPVDVDLGDSMQALSFNVILGDLLGCAESVAVDLFAAGADQSVVNHCVNVLKGLSALPIYILSNRCLILHHFLSRAWLNHNVESEKMSLLDALHSHIFSTSIILHPATVAIRPAIDCPQEYLDLIS